MRKLFDFTCGCGLAFTNTDKRAKYCHECIDNKVWLRKNGNRDFKKIVHKAQTTKLKWLSTKKAKQFYKQLGKHNSKKLKRYFKSAAGKEQIKRVAKIQSTVMKKKIAAGLWTPNITNTWTHWDANITVDNKIHKFRSSWEACFWLSNLHTEYETLRVPFNDSVVICDFVDRNASVVYEIKPISRYRHEKRKINAIIDWCLKNNHRFIWVNEHNIMDFVDTSLFKGKNKQQLDKLMEGIKYAKSND